MKWLERLRALPWAAKFALAAVVLATAAGVVWGATPGRPTSSIGYVDVDRVASEYLEPILSEPLRQETQRLQGELDKELARLDDEFEARARGLSEQEKEKLRGQLQQQKQELFVQYQQQLDRRKQELLDARLPRVREAIGKVAQRLGLEVVLDKNLVIWGGYDVTDDVLRELGVKVSSQPPGPSAGR